MGLKVKESMYACVCIGGGGGCNDQQSLVKVHNTWRERGREKREREREREGRIMMQKERLKMDACTCVGERYDHNKPSNYLMSAKGWEGVM